MEYRRLGKSGLEVSVVGLGTNNFGRRLPDPHAAARIIHAAIDEGVNFIDTSDDYGDDRASERFIGQAVKDLRDQVLIATKVGGPVSRPGDPGPNRIGASRNIIVRSLDQSLKALQTDYVDLLQVHHPDPATPVEETLRALDDQVRAGKVRYVGCSNHAAWQLCEALWISRTEHLTPYVSSQSLYNMLDRGIEQELLPFCARYEVGILPYYPLAGGFLTGKYRKDAPAPEGARLSYHQAQAKRWLHEPNYEMVHRLQRFSEERDHSVLDLAFAWLLANPRVSSVIAGATRPEQVEGNARAAAWRLSAEEKAEVDRILET